MSSTFRLSLLVEDNNEENIETLGRRLCIDTFIRYCEILWQRGCLVDPLSTVHTVDIIRRGKERKIRHFVKLNTDGVSFDDDPSLYAKLWILHDEKHLCAVVPERIANREKKNTCLVYDCLGFSPQDKNHLFCSYLKRHRLRPKRLNYTCMPPTPPPPPFSSASSAQRMSHCVIYTIVFANEIMAGKTPDKIMLEMSGYKQGTDPFNVEDSPPILPSVHEASRLP